MHQGILLKMQVRLNDPVEYILTLGTEDIGMNALIGKTVVFQFKDTIHCIRCGRVTKKSFAQGYCYPCFTTAPETSECILRPELCRAHEGISRDMKWSEEHCLGAWKAICLARTPNRYLAGKIEIALKARMSDKTNWRHMLTNKLEENIDLVSEKEKVSKFLDPELSQYIIPDMQVTEINYPVLHYPDKVKSITFDQTRYLEAVLTGIKGQYLIFEDGSVLNVRKHGGYLVAMDFSS
jgi:hypothetical protein